MKSGYARRLLARALSGHGAVNPSQLAKRDPPATETVIPKIVIVEQSLMTIPIEKPVIELMAEAPANETEPCAAELEEIPEQELEHDEVLICLRDEDETFIARQRWAEAHKRTALRHSKQMAEEYNDSYGKRARLGFPEAQQRPAPTFLRIREYHDGGFAAQRRRQRYYRRHVNVFIKDAAE